MSKAKPMPLIMRVASYLGYPDVDESVIRAQYSERDLTPAQRRRAWHKAHRSGERGGPGKGEELYGRKGYPTPRRIDARAFGRARRIELADREAQASQ